MARFLIELGVTILTLGLVWPYLSRIGVGKLPGDIINYHRAINFTRSTSR